MIQSLKDGQSTFISRLTILDTVRRTELSVDECTKYVKCILIHYTYSTRYKNCITHVETGVFHFAALQGEIDIDT
jgi:hypothetical protein